MPKKGQKIAYAFLAVFSILLIGILSLHWYRTYKLQDDLRERLGDEILKRTDGFYTLSFDKLDVSFFNGELSIKGLRLRPDSSTFHAWQEKDSLPENYVDIYIDEIYFKGINLTWSRNDRNLHFSVFELIEPQINVYKSKYSSNHTAVKHTEFKTLHELISPYIDVLSVDRISLSKADISYFIPDSTSSTTYKLTEADFRAYGFWLDKNSAGYGKLLYCDHFDFTVAEPQHLLTSDYLSLTADNIRLSTIDSLILIEGIHLYPSDKEWKQKTEKEGVYLKAGLKAVKIEGVHFERANFLNFIKARLFEIESTNIDYYSVKPENYDTTKAIVNVKQKREGEPWSLYSIISPLFQSIEVDGIKIEKTKFNYYQTHNGYTDVYMLGQFNFVANNFVLDSLAEKQKRFWYVKNFVLEGLDIGAEVPSQNILGAVSRLYLNTFEKRFSLSDIKLDPYSLKTKEDYMKGHIDSIRVDGLSYQEGVFAESVNILSPNVSFYKNIGKVAIVEQSPLLEKDSSSFLDVLKPYADFLNLKSINLRNANFSYYDRLSNAKLFLKGFNFYASDFLIDDQTRKYANSFFACKELKLDFRDFDNLIFDNKYRLKIKSGNFSSNQGSALLKGIRLEAQPDYILKSADDYTTVSLDMLTIKGFDYESYLKNKDVKINLLALGKSKIDIHQLKDNPLKKGKAKNQPLFFNHLFIDGLTVDNTSFRYIDYNLKDSLNLSFDSFKIGRFDWSPNRKLSVGDMFIFSPLLTYRGGRVEREQKVSSTSEGIKPLLRILGNEVSLGELTFSDAHLNVIDSKMELSSGISKVNLSGIKLYQENQKVNLSLANISLSDPEINYKYNSISSPHANSAVTKEKKDFYALLSPYVNTFWLGAFDVINANIKYQNILGDSVDKKQNLNKTDFSLKGLAVDLDHKKIDVQDFSFETRDLHFPIMDGFYNVSITDLNLNKQKKGLDIAGFKMTSNYPKMEFAYKHPKHKDWFDVSVGRFSLSGIDDSSYFQNKQLNIDSLVVKDIVLQNFKNQNIEIEHNVMPMIYDNLHKIPIPFSISNASVRNFSVVYEELAKGASIPGKIFFTDMNGDLKGLTNMISKYKQYIELDADGKLMGEGHFKAKWMIPVDSTNDHFFLSAEMGHFDLRNLNQLITPLASASVLSGEVKQFSFWTDASSTGATIDLRLLYNGLNVNIYKDKEAQNTNKLVTRLANKVIKTNNPNHRRDKPRISNLSITRDPYHSTFNYFWQILQPPVVESVGISQKKQNFAKKLIERVNKIKSFFTHKKHQPEKQNED